LAHEGDNPAQRDDPADRPFRENLELVKQIGPNWQEGQLDKAATTELLATLRQSSVDDACRQVVDLLKRGVGPQSIWDALHVAAGELLMRQPAIVALHAVTSTNALRFAYQTSGDDETRRLLLLQTAAFVTMFRESMTRRGQVKDVTISELTPDEKGDAAPDEILADLNQDPMLAARKLLGRLKQSPAHAEAAQQFIDAARVLVFLKGNDAHDYKFSSAVLEDYYQVSPEWRDVYLASNVFKLRGALDRDNRLVERTRAALAT
jgi:hypothetical protein